MRKIYDEIITIRAKVDIPDASLSSVSSLPHVKSKTTSRARKTSSPLVSASKKRKRAATNSSSTSINLIPLYTDYSSASSPSSSGSNMSHPSMLADKDQNRVFDEIPLLRKQISLLGIYDIFKKMTY
jgi:hypothetical protein